MSPEPKASAQRSLGPVVPSADIAFCGEPPRQPLQMPGKRPVRSTKPFRDVYPAIPVRIQPAQSRLLPALCEEAVAAPAENAERAHNVVLRARKMRGAAIRAIQVKGDPRPCGIAGPGPRFRPISGVVEGRHVVFEPVHGDDRAPGIPAHILPDNPAGIGRVDLVRPLGRTWAASCRPSVQVEDDGSPGPTAVKAIKRDFQVMLKRRLDVGRNGQSHNHFRLPQHPTPPWFALLP